MKKLNQNQLLGIAMILISTSASFFFESTLMGVLCGALAGVGVGFALKWIPFKNLKTLNLEKNPPGNQ